MNNRLKILKSDPEEGFYVIPVLKRDPQESTFQVNYERNSMVG